MGVWRELAGGPAAGRLQGQKLIATGAGGLPG